MADIGIIIGSPESFVGDAQVGAADKYLHPSTATVEINTNVELTSIYENAVWTASPNGTFSAGSNNFKKNYQSPTVGLKTITAVPPYYSTVPAVFTLNSDGSVTLNTSNSGYASAVSAGSLRQRGDSVDIEWVNDNAGTTKQIRLFANSLGYYISCDDGTNFYESSTSNLATGLNLQTGDKIRFVWNTSDFLECWVYQSGVWTLKGTGTTALTADGFVYYLPYPAVPVGVIYKPPVFSNVVAQTAEITVINPTLQTVTGKARIQKNITQTATGKARIQKSVTQFLTGLSRVQKGNLVTQTGISRAQKTVTQTNTGKSRLQKNATTSISGVANIAAGATNQNQTQLGKARVQNTLIANQIGKGRVQATSLATTLGKSRLQKTVTPTLTGKSRIQQIITQTLLGKARLQNTVTNTILGKGRVLVSGLVRTINGKARITAPSFTRQAINTLPTNNSNLATAYSAQDLTDVTADDAVRVAVLGAGYLIHQFKLQGANNTGGISISWNGQAIMPASICPVYLQIYNYFSSSWETVTSNSIANSNTDFTLSGSVTANLTNYYDGAFTVAVRIYQFVGGSN